MPDWKAVIRARAVDEGVAQDLALEELVDELAQHAEEAYRTARADGRSEVESRALVEAELYDLRRLAQSARDSRTTRLQPAPRQAAKAQLLRVAGRDLAHGMRVLVARPAFTAIAVATLALGIGANTAIFSVVYSLLLAPLPFPQPDRLVMLWEASLDDRADINIVSAPNWKDWRDNSSSFERLAIWENLIYNISGGDEPEQVSGMRVSASAFPMLGVAPRLGRTFTEAEDAPGHRVVIISDALWRRRFDANPAAIGRSLRVNGEPHEVIGVMPPDFSFMHRRYHVWTPIQLNPEDASRTSHSFLAAARLKPGLSLIDARNEFEALARRLEAQTHERHGATLTPLTELGVDAVGATLKALLGAVAVVLLIACVNVANLLLAQSAARRKEFLVRTALGASRARLAQQLLAEGLLLAIAGGAVGVCVAWAGTAALTQSLPASIAFAPFRNGSVTLNTSVLLFTAAVSVVTGLLFSLAPLAGLRRLDAGAAIKASGDRGGTSRSNMLRTALVGVEIALAVIVLVAAGLMMKSVSRLASVDPGLDPRNVLLLSVALPQPDFYGPPMRTGFCEDVQREVGTLPGVRSVGAVSQLPLEGSGAGRGFDVEGRTAPDPNDTASARYRVVCPGYFASLGIPITRGRDFTAGDTTQSLPVAIISESTASLYWPNQDPLGRRLRIGDGEWMTIVGVAADARQIRLDAVMPRMLYRSYAQTAWPSMTITVKTAGEPLSLATAAQRAVRKLDADMPVSRVRSMESVITDSMGNRRFPMQLLGLFSLVALTLATIGVYGVVSYLVAQRTRELGIRVALGARRRQVIGLVVVRSLLPIGLGLAVGIAGALVASRLLGTLLYEVKANDPAVLAGIVAMLGGAALFASFIPARRAAAVDPIVVLRHD